MSILDKAISAVSILLIALCVSVIIPNIMGKFHSSQSKEEDDLSSLDAAIKMYRLNNMKYPESLGDLLVEDGYWHRKNLPLDSWGNQYFYNFPAVLSGEKYDLGSFGADGEQGGEGENKDIYASAIP